MLCLAGLEALEMKLSAPEERSSFSSSADMTAVRGITDERLCCSASPQTASGLDDAHEGGQEPYRVERQDRFEQDLGPNPPLDER